MNIQMTRINNIINNNTYITMQNRIEENERDRRFCRHGISHSMDVARIAWIINLEENLNLDKEIVYAAALLHDIGRANADKAGKSHHIIGQKFADAILLESDFNENERKEILDAISMHNTVGKDAKGLPNVLYRADKLSRLCFNCDAYNDCYWKDEDKNKGVEY